MDDEWQANAMQIELIDAMTKGKLRSGYYFAQNRLEEFFCDFGAKDMLQRHFLSGKVWLAEAYFRDIERGNPSFMQPPDAFKKRITFVYQRHQPFQLGEDGLTLIAIPIPSERELYPSVFGMPHRISDHVS